MQISGISSRQNSFKACLPVYAGYTTDKNGVSRRLSNFEIAGPVQALVRRLNKKNSKESACFKNLIEDFRLVPRAESTIDARNILEQKHIILGQDSYTKRDLMDCCRYGSMSRDAVKDTIKNSLIAPLSKKVRLPRYEGDTVGEQVGLVLHTKEATKDYHKLEKIEFKSIDGRIFKEIDVK